MAVGDDQGKAEPLSVLSYPAFDCVVMAGLGVA
jgi:hypothetical protein